MNFINFDNTQIFNTFIDRFGGQIDLDVDIKVFSSSYESGRMILILANSDRNEDSPYRCSTYTKEISRSISLCSDCLLTEDEELACIAHEIGHIKYKNELSKKRICESEDLFDVEVYADKFAVELGLGSNLKNALLKIITANVKPELNDDINRRADLL